MSEVKDWDTTGSNNTDASPDGYPIGSMLVNQLDNTGRENMAAVKRMRDDLTGVTATTGSSNTYAFAASSAVTAYTTGDSYRIRANHTNTGAATLNIDALGAKNIFNNKTGAALIGGEIQSGSAYDVVYDGTQFLLLNGEISAANRTTMTATQLADGDLIDIYDLSATEEKTVAFSELQTEIQNNIYTDPTVQVITASGTWTKPAGLRYIEVEVVGGGGAGGGCPTSLVTTAAAGGGGGGGGQAFALIPAGDLGATETVTIGAAGTGVLGGNGGAGGASTFTRTTGSDVVGNGGSGGITQASNQWVANVGGDGGTATGGDVNITGQAGDHGFCAGSGAQSTPVGVGARGAGGYQGGGGGVGTAWTGTTGIAGGDASGYGAGGGGAAIGANTGTVAGGDGSAGLIVVREYYQ